MIVFLNFALGTFSGNGCDERRGIRQAVGMVVGTLLWKELQSPPIVLPQLH
jgi:hypothetical protein